MYLYGDGNQFPLNENFLHTLSAATDASVALLEADERRSRARNAVAMANSDAISELAELGALRGAIERALRSVPESSPAATKAASQVRELVYNHIEGARAEVKHRRETLQHRSGEHGDRSALLAALERFLTQHQLPHTTWALAWWSGRRGEGCEARAYALMPRGLAATLDVRIPTDSPWARPVRVSQFSKRLVIRLLRKSLFGGLRMGDEHLDRYYVSSVAKTPLQETLVLRTKPQEPCPGLRLTFRDGEVEQVVVQRVGEDNMPTSDPVALGGSDKVMVQRLWTHVVRSIASLINYRGQVLLATLNGTAIAELDRPATVARALISAVGPWVRTIRRHSRTPGELALKRVLDNGKQQDLFASFYEITRKYRHLPGPLRTLFDAYGLSDEPFAEIATRAWRPRHAALRQSGTRRAARVPQGGTTRSSTPQRRPAAQAEPPPMPDSSPAPSKTEPPPPMLPATARHATEPPPAMPAAVPQIGQLPPPPVIELPRQPESRPAAQQRAVQPPALPQVFRLPPPSTPPPRPRRAARKVQIHSTPPARESIPTQPTRPALRVINGYG